MSKRTPGPPGNVKRVTMPGAGMKFLAGILGIDAHFDRVAAHARCLPARKRQRLAAGDADHLAHEIDRR